VCHLAVPKITDSKNHAIKTLTRAQNAGRFFPGIIYKPGNTNKWEGRFDLTQNLQPEKNWPKYTLKAKTSDDTEVMIDVSFTYADYKAIYPQKSQELMIVPSAYYTENLVPLNDYLELEETKLYGKIPYIWILDQNLELHRAAVPNVWVVSCEERLDFWNFLQAIGSFQKIKPETQPLQNLKPTKDEAVSKQLVTKSSQDDVKSEAAMLDQAVKKVLAVLLEDK
jgi:pyruvate-ferredoxin/flavodoxin oxidoreductase